MGLRKVAEGVYRAPEGGGFTLSSDGELELDGPFREQALETARRLGFASVTLAGERIAVPGPQLEGDELSRRTLRDFFDGERLKEMPASLPRREIVLRWLATRFEPGRAYAEAEVNRLLLRHHPDFAMVRRYLVDWGLLERSGGIYRRASQSLR